MDTMNVMTVKDAEKELADAAQAERRKAEAARVLREARRTEAAKVALKARQARAMRQRVVLDALVQARQALSSLTDEERGVVAYDIGSLGADFGRGPQEQPGWFSGFDRAVAGAERRLEKLEDED